MSNRKKTGRNLKRQTRPTLDGLEPRALLSTASLLAEVRAHAEVSILAQLPSAPTRTASTIAPNGDQNPYGLAFVPNGVIGGGVLQPGDLLVSNFNDAAVIGIDFEEGNTLGAGTTIVRITPQNTQSLFYQGPPGVGFDNGLAVLKNGYVIAGFVPAGAGPGPANQGGVLVLDKNGHAVAEFTNAQFLNGPWGLTVVNRGSTATVFVANLLSGTVSRFNVSFPAGGGVKVLSATQIGSGYLHINNLPFQSGNAPLGVGPGGLAFDASTGNLYVASAGDDSIYAIKNALTTRRDQGRGTLVVHDTANLNGPLGLALASDGHLIVANSVSNNLAVHVPSTLVEYTRHGQFINKFTVSPNLGDTSAVTITAGPRPLIAYVDDFSPNNSIFSVGSKVVIKQVHGTHPIFPYGGP